MTTEIKVSTKKNVATITIDNPNSLNSINYQGWLTLASVAIDLGKSSDVRAVIFTGSGNKSFSAGADIKEFPKTRYDTNTGMKYANALHNALDAIGSIRCPTISMIKGICMGGGCELAMTTDIRIATETSTFGIPVAKLGILLAYKEMKRLIEVVGKSTASYLLYSADTFDAYDALRVGLIHKIKPITVIEKFVQELASSISETSSLSHQNHKKIMKILLKDPNLTNLTKEEEELPYLNFESDDYKEGLSAFLNHEKPNFQNPQK